MIVRKREDGSVAFKFEKVDWDRGAKSFVAIMKEQIPDGSRYFDGKEQEWVIVEVYRDRIVKLIETHFRYKIERLLA